MKLEDFDSAFNAAAAERTFPEIPDGRYSCCITDTRLKQSRNGNPMLSWTLSILDNGQEGRLLFHHNVLNNEFSVARLKQDLHACGLDLDSITQLPDSIINLIGRKITVRVKTKGAYQNIYIDGLIPEDAEDAPIMDDSPF